MIIMSMLNLAITIRSFNYDGPAINKLNNTFTITYANRSGQRLSDDALVHALSGADCVIAGTETFTEAIFEQSPRLKAISRVGTGLDSIDLAAAKTRGIAILSTPRSPIPAVTEHTISLIFSVMKNIPYYNDAMRKGSPQIRPGRMLAGKKAGIIGLGKIGARVAAALDFFGCTVTYYDPYTHQPSNPAWNRVQSLPELVKDIDILTLHASADPTAPPLINADVLSVSKRGLIIINTARGTLIDEAALLEALKNGQVSGAGLDVFCHEPYSGELLTLPQVIATPHVASNTIESRDEMEKEAVENLIMYFKERAA